MKHLVQRDEKRAEFLLKVKKLICPQKLISLSSKNMNSMFVVNDFNDLKRTARLRYTYNEVGRFIRGGQVKKK